MEEHRNALLGTEEHQLLPSGGRNLRVCGFLLYPTPYTLNPTPWALHGIHPTPYIWVWDVEFGVEEPSTPKP